MKKREKAKVGDLIKVPFKPGVHTYGRILVEGSYAFYDCLSSMDRKDYDVIISSDVLFVAHVSMFAIKKGNWTILTNIPLNGVLTQFYPRFFNPAPQNPENVNFYELYRNEIEEAIKKDWIKTGRIQLDGTHENFHIEARIRDYYEGKRNEGNKGNIWVFKKMLGLTSCLYADFT